MLNKNILSHRPGDHQNGLSLIDLLIGLAIGLVGTLVITQTYLSQESVKRTSTAAGDAQQSGSFAIYALEREIQSAGAGLAHLDSIWGCPVKAWRNNTAVIPMPATLPSPPTVADGNVYINSFYTPLHTALGANPLRFAPVLIMNGGGNATTNANSGASDSIIVMAGQHESNVIPLQSTAAPTSTSIALNNTIGVNQRVTGSPAPEGDLLAAVDLDPSHGVSDCRIVQAKDALPTTALTAPSRLNTVPNPLLLSGSTYTPASPQALNGYSSTVRIGNLGNAPRFVAFAVGADSLTPNALLTFDILQSSAQIPVSLADNVMNIQAVYGISSDATSNPVTTWVSPTGSWSIETLMDGSTASASNLGRIRAIRIAIITRSAQLEKEDVSPSSWTVFPDLNTSGNNISASGTQNTKYRYRTYDITVPLRNMLLMNNS